MPMKRGRVQGYIHTHGIHDDGWRQRMKCARHNGCFLVCTQLVSSHALNVILTSSVDALLRCCELGNAAVSLHWLLNRTVQAIRPLDRVYLPAQAPQRCRPCHLGRGCAYGRPCSCQECRKAGNADIMARRLVRADLQAEAPRGCQPCRLGHGCACDRPCSCQQCQRLAMKGSYLLIDEVSPAGSSTSSLSSLSCGPRVCLWLAVLLSRV